MPRDNNYSTFNLAVVEILLYIIAIGTLLLIGSFLNWYLYSRHERSNVVVPVSGLDQDYQEKESSIDLMVNE